MTILPDPISDAFHAAFRRLDTASMVEPFEFGRLYAPLGETLTWLMAADEVLYGKWWKGRLPPYDEGERLRLGLRWARNETLHFAQPVVQHFAGRSVTVFGSLPGGPPGHVDACLVFAETGPLEEHFQGDCYASDVAGRPLLDTIDRTWHAVTNGDR